MSYLLERTLFIPRPRAEVFSFFADACNLERITPAFLHFHILTPGPVPMHAGTVIDYELRLYGIRFHWKTLIEEFRPVSSFVEVQITGPYRRWHHTHSFEDVTGGTQMKDHVEYEMPLCAIGAITRAFSSAALWIGSSITGTRLSRNSSGVRVPRSRCPGSEAGWCCFRF